MNSVHFRSFKESFFQSDNSVIDESNNSGLIWENGFFKTLLQGFSHPQIASMGLLALLLLFSFKYRLALVLFLTFFTLVVGLYFFLKTIASKINLLFENPVATTEKQDARLCFNLTNFNDVPLINLILKFNFAGSAQLYFTHSFAPLLSARSVTRNTINLNCDIGMGRYTIEQVRLIIADPFNIFQFKIYFNQKVEIEVRPKIEDIPEIRTKGSEFSEMYGAHEVPNRGLSVNFANIRPYSFGDSIRHIAWRPSAKLGNLVVKEFEKMVNTDATIILNLNPAHHIGFDLLNTWETAKDLTLSIVSQLLNQSNSVEFIYNYGYVEKSNGRDQFYAISRLLVDHNIFEAANGEHKKRVHVDDPLAQWRQRINPSSTLFYIGAANYPYLREATALLKLLSREKVEVILTLINPLTVWPEFRKIDSSIEMPNTTSKINQLLKELQEAGVRVCFADMGGELQQNFREKSFLTETLTNKLNFKKSGLNKT